MHKGGTELSPAIANFVAVPGGCGEAGVTKRDQVPGGACWAEIGNSGHGTRGERLVQRREHPCTATAEQPAERLGRGCGSLPQAGYAMGRVDNGGLPGFFDHGGDVRPQVGARHEQESALADFDSPAVAIGQDEALARPANPRVELSQNAPEPVPRDCSGPLRDVTIKQRSDACPVWLNQRCPRFAEERGEVVTGVLRIGDETREEAASVLIVDSVLAPLDLSHDLRCLSRPDLL